MSKISNIDVNDVRKYKDRLFTKDHKEIQEGPLNKLIECIDKGLNISGLFEKNDFILLNSNLNCRVLGDLNIVKSNIEKLRMHLQMHKSDVNSSNKLSSTETKTDFNNEVAKYKVRLLNENTIQTGPVQKLVDLVKCGANIGDLSIQQVNALKTGKAKVIGNASLLCDKNFEINCKVLLNTYVKEQALTYTRAQTMSLLKNHPLKREILDELSNIAANKGNSFGTAFISDVLMHMLSDHENAKTAAKLIRSATRKNELLHNSINVDLPKIIIDKIKVNRDESVQQNLIYALHNLISNGYVITQDAQVSLEKLKKHSEKIWVRIDKTIRNAHKSYLESMRNTLLSSYDKQARYNVLQKLAELNIPEYKDIIDLERNSSNITFIRTYVRKGGLITQSCFDTIEKNINDSLDIISQILNKDNQVLPASTISVLAQNTNKDILEVIDQVIKQGKSELPDHLLKTLVERSRTQAEAITIIDKLLHKNKGYIKSLNDQEIDSIAQSLNSENKYIKDSAINVLSILSSNNKSIRHDICKTLANSDFQTEEQQRKAADIIDKHNTKVRKAENSSGKIGWYGNANTSDLKRIQNAPKYIDILSSSRSPQERVDAIKKLNGFLQEKKTLPDYAIDALHKAVTLNCDNVAAESLNTLKALSNYDKSKQLNIDEALKIQSQPLLDATNIEHEHITNDHWSWVISQVSNKIKGASNAAKNIMSSVLVNWDPEVVEAFLSRYSHNNINDLLLIQQLKEIDDDTLILALDNLDGGNDVRSLVNNVYKILNAREILEIGRSFNLNDDAIGKLADLGYTPEDLDCIHDEASNQFNQIINNIISYNIPRDTRNYKGQGIIDLVGLKTQNIAVEVSKLGAQVSFSGGAEKNLDALLAQIKEKNQDINIEDLRAKYNAVIMHYNNGIKDLSAENIQAKAKSAKDNLELIAIVKKGNELSEKQEPRTVQLLSLILMLENNSSAKGVLSQISTGEGKTTIVAMLAVINAMKGQKVDIITSSPILASDGAKKKENFYKLFGLSVGDNGANEIGCYGKDIVYGSVDNFQYDFLRQEYMLKDIRGTREFGVVIADEVDSMLIDEGSKIAMLSENIAGMEYLESFLSAIFMCTNNFLRGFTGESDNDGRLVFRESDESDEGLLVEDSIQFVKSQVIEATKKEFFSSDSKIKLPVNFIEFAQGQLGNWVDMSILATRMNNKVDYIIKDNEIKPIDADNTGIVQTNMQWQNGLHQFLQIKNGLRITPESFTTCFISNVAYFKKYGKVFGLTGTLGSLESRNLLASTYGVDCKFIPTYKQKQFVELQSLVVEDQNEWIGNIVNSTSVEVQKGRGVLIICKSIQDVEDIKNALQQSGINNVKCYSDDTQDDGIDGKPIESGQVIVATNLAGRGTDIDANNIQQYDGLHVCLTFLPNNQRVEDQAFGRTARQGQKGTAQLIIKSYGEINAIKAYRDEREAERLAKIQNHELREIAIKDKLFLEKFMPYIADLRQNKANENIIKSIEERWGLFLASLRFDDGFQQSFIESQYETFIGGIHSDERDIQNHCYFTKMGNELLGEGKYAEAISKFNKAIEKDPNFAYTAHYNKAYAIIQNKGSDQDAKSELEKAKEIIDEMLLPQLQAMGAVAQLCANAFGGYSNNDRPATELELQVNAKMGLLNIHKKCIEDAINTIINKKGNTTIVVDTETSFEDMYESDVPTKEIMELRGNGFRSLFTIKEKPPTNWWGIIGVAILGALQVVAGAALTACGIVNVGAALIGEGVGDLITATKSAISGEFSWSEYLKDKAISLAISVVTMGASAIKSAVKAAGSVAGAVKQSLKQAGAAFKNVAGKGAQKAATTAATTELAKDGWKIAGKKVFAEAMEQGVAELGNYGIGLLTGEILKQFESNIRSQVQNKLDSSIDKNKLNELLLDGNTSEQIFKSAEEFFDEESNDLLNAGKQVLAGIANAKKGKYASFKALSDIMQIAEVTAGIASAISHAGNFCAHINNKMTTINTTKKTQDGSQDTSKADKLLDQWAKYVTDGIIATIHGRVISPISSKFVSKGAGTVSNWAQRHLSSQGHTFDDKAYLWQQRRSVHKEAEKIANGSAEHNHGTSSPSRTSQNRSNPNLLRTKTDLVHPNREGGMLDVAALARHLNRPIVIYKDGKPYHALGTNNTGGKPIELDYTPPSNGKPGHWEPHGTKAHQSGNNNCLFDAIAHQAGKNPHELRNIADNARNDKSNKYMQKARSAEAAVLEGDRKASERLGMGGVLVKVNGNKTVDIPKRDLDHFVSMVHDEIARHDGNTSGLGGGAAISMHPSNLKPRQINDFDFVAVRLPTRLDLGQEPSRRTRLAPSTIGRVDVPIPKLNKDGNPTRANWGTTSISVKQTHNHEDIENGMVKPSSILKSKFNARKERGNGPKLFTDTHDISTLLPMIRGQRPIDILPTIQEEQ